MEILMDGIQRAAVIIGYSLTMKLKSLRKCGVGFGNYLWQLVFNSLFETCHHFISIKAIFA